MLYSHSILCDMATNLELDNQALEELMLLGGFKTKRKAVDAAVLEAIAYRKQLKSCDLLGTIDFIPLASDGLSADE